jgi:hypothetical protein
MANLFYPSTRVKDKSLNNIDTQIIEVCMAASHRTGGLMEAGELRQRLIKSRGSGRKNKNSQSQNKNQVRFWLLGITFAR